MELIYNVNIDLTVCFLHRKTFMSLGGLHCSKEIGCNKAVTISSTSYRFWVSRPARPGDSWCDGRFLGLQQQCNQTQTGFVAGIFPLLSCPLLHVVHVPVGHLVQLFVVVGWLLLVSTKGSNFLVGSNVTLIIKSWPISCFTFLSLTWYMTPVLC